MIYCTINAVKNFKSCPDGPKIFRWFEKRYDPDEPISLLDMYDAFGMIYTMFVLRVGEEGIEFAIKHAAICAARVLPTFERTFYGNRMAFKCINTAANSLIHPTPSKLRLHPEILLHLAQECEVFCDHQLKPEQDKARFAGLSAARVAYAAYSRSYGPTSIGYCLGALEDAEKSTDNHYLERSWQSARFREALLEYPEEVVLGRRE